MSAIKGLFQEGALYVYLQKPWKKYSTFQTDGSYFIVAIANPFDILQLEKGDADFLRKGRNTKVIGYGQLYKCRFTSNKRLIDQCRTKGQM